MRLSGKEILRTLNDYFSQGSYEADLFLMLLFPLILIFVFIWVMRSNSTGEKDPFLVIPPKDMDFIETLRQQKGLEEFDRDFLIDLALNNNIKPVYQIFLSLESFEKIEKSITQKLKEKDQNPSADRSLNQLKSLKKRLFLV